MEIKEKTTSYRIQSLARAFDILDCSAETWHLNPAMIHPKGGKTFSVCHIKPLKLTDVGFPSHIDMIHLRQRRTFPAPRQGRLHRILRSLKNSLNRTITPIPHPTCDTGEVRCLFGFHSITDPLNPTGDDGMRPDHFFHTVLPVEVKRDEK
jgi:hypothetical protein